MDIIDFNELPAEVAASIRDVFQHQPEAVVKRPAARARAAFDLASLFIWQKTKQRYPYWASVYRKYKIINLNPVDLC